MFATFAGIGADFRHTVATVERLPDRLATNPAARLPRSMFATVERLPDCRTACADCVANGARTACKTHGAFQTGADMGGAADGLQGRFRRDLGGRGSNGCGDCRADGQRWRGRRAISGDIGRNRRGVAGLPRRTFAGTVAARLPRSMFATACRNDWRTVATNPARRSMFATVERSPDRLAANPAHVEPLTGRERLQGAAACR